MQGRANLGREGGREGEREGGREGGRDRISKWKDSRIGKEEGKGRIRTWKCRLLIPSFFKSLLPSLPPYLDCSRDIGRLELGFNHALHELGDKHGQVQGGDIPVGGREGGREGRCVSIVI